MLDKILRVNENLVVIYYTTREPLRCTSDNGTALEYAMGILEHVVNFETDEDLEPTVVMRNPLRSAA